MASVSTQKRTGLRRVIFQSIDGRRVSLHVGRLSKPAAREIGAHVDHLVTCRRSGSDLRRTTREWVEHISSNWPRLAIRLAELGLIPRIVAEDPIFAAYVDSQIDRSHSVRPNTLRTRRQTADKIRQFFTGRRIRSLNAQDGADFLRWLKALPALGGAGHTAATAGKHYSHARMFLGEAVRAGMLSDNPFHGIRTGRTCTHERRRYISASVVVQVLNATCDMELRAVLALSRWGGLRIPSEAFALQWQHIDWNRRRIVIPGVKTKGREIPLFPELVPDLSAMQLNRTNTMQDEFLLPGLRRFTGANLRKRTVQLVRSAGLPVWPRIFQNLRSSRQTELEERFPRKTVCEWMGNSEQVADRHYLQVLDEHFERAAADSECGADSER